MDISPGFVGMGLLANADLVEEVQNQQTTGALSARASTLRCLLLPTATGHVPRSHHCHYEAYEIGFGEATIESTCNADYAVSAAEAARSGGGVLTSIADSLARRCLFVGAAHPVRTFLADNVDTAVTMRRE